MIRTLYANTYSISTFSVAFPTGKKKEYTDNIKGLLILQMQKRFHVALFICTCYSILQLGKNLPTQVKFHDLG